MIATECGIVSFLSNVFYTTTCNGAAIFFFFSLGSQALKTTHTHARTLTDYVELAFFFNLFFFNNQGVC